MQPNLAMWTGMDKAWVLRFIYFLKEQVENAQKIYLFSEHKNQRAVSVGFKGVSKPFQRGNIETL